MIKLRLRAKDKEREGSNSYHLPLTVNCPVAFFFKVIKWVASPNVPLTHRETANHIVPSLRVPIQAMTKDPKDVPCGINKALLQKVSIINRFQKSCTG